MSMPTNISFQERLARIENGATGTSGAQAVDIAAGASANGVSETINAAITTLLAYALVLVAAVHVEPVDASKWAFQHWCLGVGAVAWLASIILQNICRIRAPLSWLQAVVWVAVSEFAVVSAILAVPDLAEIAVGAPLTQMLATLPEPSSLHRILGL